MATPHRLSLTNSAAVSHQLSPTPPLRLLLYSVADPVLLLLCTPSPTKISGVFPAIRKSGINIEERIAKIRGDEKEDLKVLASGIAAALAAPKSLWVSEEGFVMSHIDLTPSKKMLLILDIDLTWRMHKSSDGQRRRVQICMGLLKTFKVLLLDEIAVDLGVLARANLLRYLMKECEERGAVIIYATHIFDGLDNCPSHVVRRR